MNTPTLPIVLIFAGHDPTGGAGIQADIETLISLGCHPAPVVTALTVQDTIGVKRFVPVDPELVIEQARAVLEDMPVAACKTGMLGSTANATAIGSLLHDYEHLPVVVDPVLASGRGDPLSEEPLEQALKTMLFPHTTLVTPNTLEAQRLAPGADTVDARAQALLTDGCEYVLLTGGHAADPEVINRLYGGHRLLETYRWKRLPENFHGSGCTLAAACAANLAHGVDIMSAVAEAQDFAWRTLANARRLGMGQLLPDRLFWARGKAKKAT